MKRLRGVENSAAKQGGEAGRAQRACVASLLLVAVATAAWGFDAQEAPDLSTVFPSRVPRGLRDNDWAVLNGNWEQWSQETADAVASFYDAQDSAARKAALERLHVKLHTMETALADPAYSMIYPELAGLHGQLARRVAIADAVFAMTNPEADRAAQVSAAYDGVADSLETLREDLQGIPGGSAWLPYVKAEDLAAVVADNDSSEKARDILATAHGKIVGREGLTAEQSEFLDRPDFAGLGTAIETAIGALNWSPPEGYEKKLVGQLSQLVQSIEQYEEDGGSEAAAAVRAHYNTIRDMNPAAAEPLSHAMRNSYFNYNVRITASEGLMRRFASEHRTEPGSINEPVGEAWVSGYSCTYTNASVDLKPNSRVAQLDIVVDGTVQARTTANASQAVVYGGSTGRFRAVKPVLFDGHNFTLDPTRVSANVSTYANDVDAKVFFLFRPIADAIAAGEVARRKPQNDAIARSRVVSQVSQQLDTEVDDRFANASTKLEADVYGPLRELGWYPDAISMSTTETELLARARLMEPTELAASAPSWSPVVPSEGIVIQVHQSALDNGAARMDIAGRTMTGADLRAELENRLKKLFGENFELKGGGEEAPATEPAPENIFVFDKVDPLRFEIGDGNVSVIMRTGLKREGEEDIDTHILTIPLSFHVEGDKIVMQRSDNVRVVPAPGVARNIPQQGIMRRNIEDAITERTLDSELKVEQEGKTVVLHINDIQAIDGWVTVSAK